MHSYWTEFWTLMGLHTLAVMSPGPDFALIVRQSVCLGRRPAIHTSLGIAAGIFVHVCYTLVGVGALLHATPWLFNGVRLIGAGYVSCLGICMLRSKPRSGFSMEEAPPSSAGQPAGVARADARKVFMAGFLTNVTNPKVTLFFLAIFTTVVSARTPWRVQALYGTTMAFSTAVWFVLVSLFFSTSQVRLAFLRLGHWFERIMGVVLILLALRLLLSFGG